MRNFYSKHEQAKFKRTRRYYLDLGYDYQTAQQYASDHLLLDRKAKSVYQETK